MRRLRLILAIVGVALSGCSSPNPAAPPAPPAEVPALLVFPESVAIDVSTAGASASSALSALGEEEGAFSDIIALGPSQARTVNDEILSGLLFPFAQFEIPVGPAVSKFAGEIVPDEPGVIPQLFRFDFADFDFNGDGETEGCTGCTCPLGCAPDLTACPSEVAASDLKPVCFRIWIQRDPVEPFERVMSGVFNILPVKDDPETPDVDEENPGRGRFQAGVVNQGGDVGGVFGRERFLAGVVYDHRQPDHPRDKSTEAFLINDFVIDGEIVFSNNIHLQVAQLEKTDPAGKTYLENNVTSAEEQTGTGDSGIENSFFQQYVGRFRDDADFWSGFVFTRDHGTVLRNLPPTCARISTGVGAPRDVCSDLDIDTTGEAFVDLAADADVVFPDDFPESPTF